MSKPTLGEHLRTLRQKRNLTVDELAHRSKIHRVAIYYYERNERQPTIDNLRRLANALGISIGEFHRCLPYQESKPIKLVQQITPQKKIYVVPTSSPEDDKPLDSDFFDIPEPRDIE